MTSALKQTNKIMTSDIFSLDEKKTMLKDRVELLNGLKHEIIDIKEDKDVDFIIKKTKESLYLITKNQKILKEEDKKSELKSENNQKIKAAAKIKELADNINKIDNIEEIDELHLIIKNTNESFFIISKVIKNKVR